MFRFTSRFGDVRPSLLKPMLERDEVLKDKLVNSQSLPLENDLTTKIVQRSRATNELKESPTENKFFSGLCPDEAKVLEKATQILEYVIIYFCSRWRGLRVHILTLASSGSSVENVNVE